MIKEVISEVPQMEVKLSNDKLQESARTLIESFRDVFKMAPDLNSYLINEYWERASVDGPISVTRTDGKINTNWIVNYTLETNYRELLVIKTINNGQSKTTEDIRIRLKEDSSHKPPSGITYSKDGANVTEDYRDTQTAIDRANEVLLSFENSIPNHIIQH